MALARICALQRQYGMTEAELETLVEGFSWAIERSGFPALRWTEALADWLLRHNEIPRPADIMNLISPPPPVYSAAVYVQVKKNLIAGNVFVTDEEKAYCRAFEKQELAKVRGGTDEYRQAQQELETHSRQLLIDHV